MPAPPLSLFSALPMPASPEPHHRAPPAPGLPAAPLQARGLSCRRGRRLLFRDLDLSIGPGEVVWLRGANGRGKTSLLRLLTGLSTPDAGQLSWQGDPLRQAGADFRRALLYIGHANGLKDDLSAAESLRFLAQIHGRPASTPAIDQALTALGMHNRRHAPVRTLSQGQKRRVALARLALDLQDPAGARLWVLDEPYDALDVDGIDALNGLLSQHAARAGCTVLTSHLPMSLAQPAPRVLQLDAPPGPGDRTDHRPHLPHDQADAAARPVVAPA